MAVVLSICAGKEKKKKKKKGKKNLLLNLLRNAHSCFHTYDCSQNESSLTSFQCMIFHGVQCWISEVTHRSIDITRNALIEVC